MFVVVTRRVVKVNTGSTEKFAPRSRNETVRRVSGPFPTLRVAQKAAFRCLGIPTCIDAQVWSETHVRAELAKGSGMHFADLYEVLRESVRLFDMASEEVTA